MPRGARRPAGAARLAALALGGLLLSACGSAGQPASYDATGIDGLEIPTPSPDPGDFVGEVDNPWFPLSAGQTRHYVLEEDGQRVGRILVEVLDVTSVAGLDATGVRTSVRADGAEPATVVRYYAQDEAGNVWLVGQDGAEGDSGEGWRAGAGGAEAGLVMPAEPRIGDGWVKAEVPGAEAETVRVDEPGIVVPEGVEGDTVWTTEDGEARTRNVYEAGVGLVESIDLDSGRTATLVDPPG